MLSKEAIKTISAEMIKLLDSTIEGASPEELKQANDLRAAFQSLGERADPGIAFEIISAADESDRTDEEKAISTAVAGMSERLAESGGNLVAEIVVSTHPVQLTAVAVYAMIDTVSALIKYMRENTERIGAENKISGESVSRLAELNLNLAELSGSLRAVRKGSIDLMSMALDLHDSLRVHTSIRKKLKELGDEVQRKHDAGECGCGEHAKDKSGLN